ncbi:MAG TPA: hypothetical protein VFH09_00315 [Nitrososphaera sp.]|nr:hypothetical protein [Nitrososphaera sp.]
MVLLLIISLIIGMKVIIVKKVSRAAYTFTTISMEYNQKMKYELTNDTHPLAERILRKEATSFYDCYTSSASLRAHIIANDIFMPYLDGLFDITNRIAEEGKMAAGSICR